MKKTKTWEDWMWEHQVKHLKSQIDFLEKELSSYKETLHLVSTKGNWKSIMKSIKNVEDGKVISLKELEDGR